MPGKTQNLSLAKMLSPEEISLLGNMQSTLNEILTMQNGDGAGEGADQNNMMEALKKLAAQNNMGDIESPEDMGSGTQEPVKKEDNGPTANEDAEARAEAITDINDQNLSEVGKTLLSLIVQSARAQGIQQPVTKSQMVTKSANNQDNNNVNLAVIKTLEIIAKKIEGMEQFNNNILDALGFSQKIEKSQDLQGLQGLQSIQKSQNTPPVQTIDATGVVNELINVIKSQSAVNPQSQNQQPNFRNDWNGMQATRKSLADAMPLIFKNAVASREK